MQKEGTMTVVNAINPSVTWDTFRVVVTREVTSAECPWLKQDLVVGRELFVSSDPYRVCGPTGLPVTDGKTEYMFEVPLDAVVGIIES